MTRVAFTLIGGRLWTGVYNYLVNLLRLLNVYERGDVEALLFLGDGVAPDDACLFEAPNRARIVRAQHFDAVNVGSRLRRAIATGSDAVAARAFARATRRRLRAGAVPR